MTSTVCFCQLTSFWCLLLLILNIFHYYIQDYPGYFRGDTETKTIASDFIWPLVKSSLTRQESRNAHSEGGWLTWTIRTEAFHKLLTWTRLENNFQCQNPKNEYSSLWSFSVLFVHDEFFMLFLFPAWAFCCCLSYTAEWSLAVSIMVTNQQAARSSSTDTTTDYLYLSIEYITTNKGLSTANWRLTSSISLPIIIRVPLNWPTYWIARYFLAPVEPLLAWYN